MTEKSAECSEQSLPYSGGMYRGALVGSSVWRDLLLLALPILGTSLLQLVTGSINAIWVGRCLGSAALAGVSNANAVLILLFAGALGLWMAITVSIGTHLGAGRAAEAKRVIRTAGFVCGAAAAVLVIPLLSYAAPLLRALDVPQDALNPALIYLRVMLIAVPATYLYGMIVAVLRGAGDSLTGLYFSLVTVAVDAGLNPVLIAGVGPIPGYGVAGSALATLLGQAVGLIGLVVYLSSRGHPLSLRTEDLAFRRGDWGVTVKLLRLGGPMGVEYFCGALLALLMISLVNRFGSVVTAAYGAMVQLWNCAMMPSVAISTAAISMAARCIGARRWDQVGAITRAGVLCGTLSTGLVVLVLVASDGRALAPFFSGDSAAILVGSQINREASWSCILFAVYAGLLSAPRAAGAVWGPLGLWVIVLGMRYPMAEGLLGTWGAQAIWWSIAASGGLAAIAAGFYYRFGRWRPDS